MYRKMEVVVLIGMLISSFVLVGSTYGDARESRVIPTVIIEAPDDGDILDDTVVTIDIYYSAGAIGRVTDVWLYIDGYLIKHWTPNANSGHEYYDWDYTTYHEGEHVIRADVENLDGETDSDTINVYVNLEPPYGYISNPSANSIISGSSVSFTVKAIDNGSGIYSISYYIDDTLLHTDYLSWPDGYQSYIIKTYTLDTTRYSDGVHTLTARIYDNSGNVNTGTNGGRQCSTSIQVIIDNNPPTINITSPESNSFVKDTVNISANAYDDGCGIDYVEFYVDGTKLYTDNESPYYYLWDTTSYGNGNHQIKVIAYDKAGYFAEDSIYLYVDNDNPSIQITSPQDGSILNIDTVNITWTGSDANSGIDHYEIRIDSSSWKDVGTATSYQFTGLNDGSHTVDVKAVDKAGNEMIDSVSFVVDTGAPTVEITSPTTGSIYNTSDISVSWSGSDTTSGIDHYEIKLDSNSWINVGTNTTYTFSNLPDGNHQIGVKAVDKAGNTAIDSVNIIVDETPPTLEIISPKNGTTLSNQTVTIKWNSSDSTSGIDHFEIKIDNESWIDVQTQTSYQVVLEIGQHTVYVKAVDKAQNYVIASTSFTINPQTDSIPPIIKITQPSNNAILDSGDITIKWVGWDNQSGINHYEIKIDDGNWVNVGKNTSYRVYLSVGKHTIIVKAVDNAGNSATSKINIEISAPAGGGSGEGGETTNPSGKATNWLLIILALIAAIVVASIIFALLKRKQRKHGTQETKEVQEEKESEKEETQKEDEKEEKRD